MGKKVTPSQSNWTISYNKLNFYYEGILSEVAIIWSIVYKAC